MLELVCHWFYWPHVASQVKEHIDKCCPCFTFKAKQPKALLENIMATHPLELIHLNYLCLEPGKDLEENVLSGNRAIHLVCANLCYTIPDCPDNCQSPLSLSTMDYLKRYSQIRVEILNQLVADVCKLMGIQKLQTSLYHPQTNGQCKRFNSTLIGMLGTLTLEKKSDWKNHIGALVHAYNCTWNSAARYSPYYIMYRG